MYGLRRLAAHHGLLIHELIEDGADAEELHAQMDHFIGSLQLATIESLEEEGMGAPCHDCGKDTRPCDFEDGYPAEGWELYMVEPEVWEEAGAGDGRVFLCVGCLEERLGRKLRPEDFTAVDLNEPSELDSSRLKDRRGS